MESSTYTVSASTQNGDGGQGKGPSQNVTGDCETSGIDHDEPRLRLRGSGASLSDPQMSLSSGTGTGTGRGSSPTPRVLNHRHLPSPNANANLNPLLLPPAPDLSRPAFLPTEMSTQLASGLTRQLPAAPAQAPAFLLPPTIPTLNLERTEVGSDQHQDPRANTHRSTDSLLGPLPSGPARFDAHSVAVPPLGFVPRPLTPNGSVVSSDPGSLGEMSVRSQVGLPFLHLPRFSKSNQMQSVGLYASFTCGVCEPCFAMPGTDTSSQLGTRGDPGPVLVAVPDGHPPQQVHARA